MKYYGGAQIGGNNLYDALNNPNCKMIALPASDGPIYLHDGIVYKSFFKHNMKYGALDEFTKHYTIYDKISEECKKYFTKPIVSYIDIQDGFWVLINGKPLLHISDSLYESQRKKLVLTTTRPPPVARKFNQQELEALKILKPENKLFNEQNGSIWVYDIDDKFLGYYLHSSNLEFYSQEYACGKDESNCHSLYSINQLKFDSEKKTIINNNLKAAINCLHNHGIAHNDLHSNNIIFQYTDTDTDIPVYIIDFGLSIIDSTDSNYQSAIDNDTRSIEEHERFLLS